MSTRESCPHHFEHVKQTLPFTEREYMECTKCGLQNPLGLFQTVDFSQPGTPVYASKPGHVQATGWNINKGRTWNPALGQYPPIPGRTGYGPTIDQYVKNIRKNLQHPIAVRPLITVRKSNNMWVFRCSHCPDYSVSPYWKLIYLNADYHARNHHGR